MRSLLLVEARDAGSLDRAFGSGADALILDLEVEEAATAIRLRSLYGDFLEAAQTDDNRPLLYIRLAHIDTETLDDDLAALMAGAPDGLVLGQCASGASVQRLGAKLAVHEAEHGLTDGATVIIAEAGSTAQGLLALASYREASERLMGLTWDAPGLALDLGSAEYRASDGVFSGPLLMARSLTLFGARAAGVAAIDGRSAELQAQAFRAECDAARRDGFNAKIVATSEQIEIANAVFDPSN